jgi:hypothetical protein
MYEYEGMQYRVVIRLDGKYYCRIYKHGIPLALYSTSYFNTEEEAIRDARKRIRAHQAITDDL